MINYLKLQKQYMYAYHKYQELAQSFETDGIYETETAQDLLNRWYFRMEQLSTQLDK